ncbi:hypothetical protein LOTGIDRAFT_211804 [Lottia gigantea]|uniref:Arrestin C-terminal-like domain-containing protein n=1 Tax=Lottia gigantea TaxID=225164 RepID=V4B3Q7_LOTGI|nr:hypothetical protein LOTGIDRAFT_211804 [Lottia gigantea]ESP05023.1 hypothetical protein LOTGIDRAFT_211804 [Lottia gigantea]
MSAIHRLLITLEHDIDEQYQYQPGEIIRGHIIATLSRNEQIRNITISIFGEGNVGWEDEKTGENNQASETYIDSKTVIMESQMGKPLVLKQGHREFPFEYELPENLPSSFIGKHGSVTYILKGMVIDYKNNVAAITSEPFLVLRKKPLPESIESPMLLGGSKRVWGGCSLGKITVSAAVNKHGGIPGEDILINMDVKNRSGCMVKAIQASVNMHSIYHAGKKTTSFSQCVNRKRDEPHMEKNEGRRWMNSRLTVPPYIPETKLEHCDIIEIHYTFQIRLEIEGNHEICLESPLLIGAHPAGLELPNKNYSRNSINSEWTVRARGLVMEQQVMLSLKEEDEMKEWYGGVIPELRSDAAISNPLFRQGSFLNKQGRYPEVLEYKRKQNGHLEELPEIMESTKL